MNASSDIISVDPGKKTLGALHPEICTKIWKSGRTVLANRHSAKSQLFNFVFTSARQGNTRYGVKTLILRLSLAAIIIVSGAFILHGEIYPPTGAINEEAIAYAEIITGSMLALGFLTRFAMLSCVAGFGYLAVTHATQGVFDMESLLACMACLTFLIMGAGRYSCDFLLRKAIINSKLRRKKNIAEKRMTYRAYRYASYN